MARSATNQRLRQHTAARLRAVRRRSAAWPRAAHRGLALGAVALVLLACPAVARAQMGQAAMRPTAGLVNSGLQRFQNLSDNGPGWMYWGVNGADRGLGYRGSYMTLGGFVPMAEDDLGGFWAADLRSHLSEFGGFFSNVGAVRKQFIGGTLLGVGVYWDYDGDQNQYAATPIVGTPFMFAGGQSYNQVGVSGEWLTDWGNLRSNGYIPVGETAQLTGPFVGNVVLCQNGINAALGGADLEVGAYIPGLSDWAGMISVGGYALGNTRYTFPNGAAAVPWFGGVYTRLDMTFIKNWDFSLQANNDSFFDWTGFARLTYRMGGSRRRNVPDQMEQPMMRNEHIVRARQAPEVAINPFTASPYRVFHVDNSATGPGTGTAESPFTTLTPAQFAAVNPYDIVYVHVGNSATTPYITPLGGYAFNTTNQYLIGEGSTLSLLTANCGTRQLFAGRNPGLYPVITNPIGAAIAVDQAGSVVSHFRITGSPVGISDGSGLGAPGSATISDVIVAGGAGIPQRGVEIVNAGSTGTFNFDRLQLVNLTNGGILQTAGNSTVNVTNSTFSRVEGTAFRVAGEGARASIRGTTIDRTAGTALLASGSGAGITLTRSTIANTTGNAVVASGAGATVSGTDFSINATGASALVASGSGARIAALRGSVATTGSDAAVVSGTAALMNLVTTSIRGAAGNGATVSGSNARLFLSGASSIDVSSVDGVRVTGVDNRVLVQDSTIASSGNNGVTVRPGAGSTTTQVTLLRSNVRQSTGFAVSATGAGGPAQVVQVFGSTISQAGVGISGVDSNLDIRHDPTVVNGRATTIQNTGIAGVVASGNSRVQVANTSISGADVGILVANGVDRPANDNTLTQLTAANNTINAGTTGISLIASGTVDPTFVNGSEVLASLSSNRISISGTTGGGIRLVTENPTDGVTGAVRISTVISPVELGAANFGTSVVEDPATGEVIYGAPLPFLPPQPVPIVPVVPALP